MKSSSFLRRLLDGIKNYRFKSVFIRDFAIMVTVVLLLLSITSLTFMKKQLSGIESEILASDSASLKSSADIIDSVLSEAYDMAYALSTNVSVRNCVTIDNKHTSYASWSNNIKEYLDILSISFDHINEISLYSALNDNVLNRRGTRARNGDDEAWFEQYEKFLGSRILTIFQRRGNSYPYWITIICPILGVQNETVGAVLLNLNIEDVSKMIGDSVDSKQCLYMVDENGQLYYCSDIRYISGNDNLPDVLTPFIGAKNDNSHIISLNGERYIIANAASNHKGFTYIHTAPYSLYQYELDNISKFYRIFIVSALVAGIVIVLLLTKQLTKRLSDIIVAVDEAAEYHATAPVFVPQPGKNEIEHITNIIKCTVEENAVMKVELEDRINKLNIEQIRALQSQIDPHFLYNSLDTIRWMAIEQVGGAENVVSGMVSALANLLRVSLDTSHYIVNLSEEIGHVQMYMKIVEARHKGRITIMYDIPAELMNCKVVKLSIQPLIENAVLHGLRPRRYCGTICISALRELGHIRISVYNDGVGMDEQQIADIRRIINDETNDTKGHVGLNNVNRRIKLIYGKEYGLEISSDSTGTNVSFCVPETIEDSNRNAEDIV